MADEDLLATLRWGAELPLKSTSRFSRGYGAALGVVSHVLTVAERKKPGKPVLHKPPMRPDPVSTVD